MTQRGIIVTTFCGLFAVSCDSAQREPHSTVFSDSAGIRIAVTDAGVFRDRSAGELTQVATIGDNTTEVLYDVSAAIVVDSTAVILNRGEREILLYDLGRRKIRSVTLPEEGPGAAKDPTQLLVSPHGFTIWDAGQGIAHEYATDGSLRNSHRVDLQTAVAMYPQLTQVMPAARWTMVANDRLLLRLYQPPQGDLPEGAFRPPVTYLYSNFDMSTIDTLGSFRGSEQVAINVANARRVLPAIYPNDTYFAPSPMGSQFYVADSQRQEVLRFDSAGTLMVIVRIDGSPPEPTDDEVREGRLALARQLREWRIPAADSLAALAPEPGAVPSIRGLLADESGRVWVRIPRAWAGTEVGAYALFRQDGGFDGTVLLPEDGELLFVTERHAVSLRRDELDREQVVMYRLDLGS